MTQQQMHQWAAQADRHETSVTVHRNIQWAVNSVRDDGCVDEVAMVRARTHVLAAVHTLSQQPPVYAARIFAQPAR
jgi:hypothetical protein